jgi:cobalt-precorrin-5B (C1)-methyltransferase
VSRGASLRHGYTTGACAAAAAKAAVRFLLSGTAPESVTLRLPWGAAYAEDVPFHPVALHRGENWARAAIVKDGGDDPDVTDGMEIRATVHLLPEFPRGAEECGCGCSGDVHVEIEGGEGVGRATKPGLAVAPGESAINPVPRRMIEMAVREAVSTSARHDGPLAFRVVVSAPEGAERAQRTLNHRLGIVGGISILGTTGIVIPMSAAAWTATIDACLDVARAEGADRAILAFGRTSERAAQGLFPELADHAAVLMGDHVGYALDASAKRGMDLILAGQFAKFCKVAAGHYATHVRDSMMDMGVLERILSACGFPAQDATNALSANTAREVYQRLAASGDRGVFERLTLEVAQRASDRVNGFVAVEAVLFGYAGECLARVLVKRRGTKW